ncbi:MAG: oxygen-independent coproporphyrinogen III oxidase [Lachnospiraceae bacterium]|nr:oxygen-independent coproporphyrinogen III oxidase [Lachnospiraceae bacterium]
MIGVYIHIPFCVRKCLYCDFVSYVRTEEIQKAYIDRLVEEIEDCPVSETVDTVFIGGGTPSVLSFGEIGRVMDALRRKFVFAQDCECSIEVNPGTVDLKKMSAYREYGINRLSIGLQSWDDTQLKTLGRIHTCEEFEKTFWLAREAGFDNVNVDLMSAIPGQTRQSYAETLQKVLSLAPEHISAYSLIVEEGTPFAHMELDLPQEEEEREMYYDTKRILSEAGYDRYEISNYAKKGFACRHNVGYWTGKEYLGFGVAAASFYQGMRMRNQSSLEDYLEKGPSLEEKVMLTKEDMMSEFFFVGLRMMKGVSERAFEERFSERFEERFGNVIRKHMDSGLLVKDEGFLCLTEKGIDVSNYVLCDFVL